MALIVLASLTAVGLALWWPIRTVWRRSRFARERPWFHCRLAVWDSANAELGGAFDGVDPDGQDRATETWCRFRARATWRGDVLLIRRRWWPSPCWRVSVSLPVGCCIHDERPSAVRGLGPHPQSLIIPRAGTQRLKVAVKQADRDRLAGPFVVMAFATST